MAGDQSPFQSGMDCCFTASATQKGQDINVAALVSALQNQGSLNCPHPGQKDPISVNPGEVPVGVDLAAAKAVEINMVVVRAADIADALAAKGTFDLYGILFDVDKTDIKPESGKTLDQVAALLKVDRSLKLEISGHADNSGDKKHNQKLSEGRAQAVVDVLAKQYGVDPSRLQAKGHGDAMPIAPNDDDADEAKNTPRGTQEDIERLSSAWNRRGEERRVDGAPSAKGVERTSASVHLLRETANGA